MVNYKVGDRVVYKKHRFVHQELFFKIDHVYTITHVSDKFAILELDYKTALVGYRQIELWEPTKDLLQDILDN